MELTMNLILCEGFLAVIAIDWYISIRDLPYTRANALSCVCVALRFAYYTIALCALVNLFGVGLLSTAGTSRVYTWHQTLPLLWRGWPTTLAMNMNTSVARKCNLQKDKQNIQFSQLNYGSVENFCQSARLGAQETRIYIVEVEYEVKLYNSKKT